MKLLNTLIITFMTFSSSSILAVDLNFFGGDDEEEVIWEVSTNVYLKYAKQGKSDIGKNDHPVELNEEQIRKSLELLVIQQVDYEDPEEGSMSVFTPLQINMLSKQLTRGLIKARPDQDIIFALKKNKDRFLGLKQAQFFVAGRAFYKDGKLNIIIGDYDFARQKGYENAYDPTHMGIVAYTFNHGKRSKSAKKFKAPIVEVEGVELKDSQRSDWFVFDLNVASKTYDLQARVREKDELEGKRKELRAILGESGTSAKERAQNSKERREMREEMARMRKEMGGKSSSSRSLEERLATLDQLKKKGLVSDKEYQTKRKEILNDI